MRAYGLSHKGMLREKNEDSFDIIYWGENNEEFALIIADGMGGHQAGEVASKLAIDAFSAYVTQSSGPEGDLLDLFTEGIHHANKEVYRKSLTDQSFSGMGTTFTACTVKNGKGYAAHVGDSRLYLINQSGLKQISTDHSYVNEMMRAGQLTEAEALVHPSRNALTRAVGVGGDVEVDGYIFEFEDNDRILMCTDGLTNMVREEIIYDMVLYAGDIKTCAEDLISVANQNGGADNITVVLAETER